MLKEYTIKNFAKTIRMNRTDKGNLLALPYPYTVPCVSDTFQEMYYWDTYFTNLGLLRTSHENQALNNTNNILYMIEKYGYMPNGNRTFYLKNSQPPFASLMVKDVYEVFGDKQWLKNATETLVKEHGFWTSRRMTEIGLNQYGLNPEHSEDIPQMPQLLRDRLQIEPPIETDELLTYQMVANGESGWDITPRFEFEAFNYSQIDLNSLLYALESNISYFYAELSDDENSEIWKNKAIARAELIRKYMLNEENIFLDYNFKKKSFSPIFSVASIYPLFVGLATENEAKALVDKLPALEYDYGISTCEKNDFPGTYQWDYPNGWAPLQYVTIKGLLNYGYEADAKRIAKKYITIVEENFIKTKNLWEKYNVVDGSLNTTAEYVTPAMIGWTAGVYVYCKELLGE